MARSTFKTPRARTRASTVGQVPPLGPVEQLAIDLLKPYPGNARTHDDRQLQKIAASLESFGWMNPILAETDGTIIAGHGRWLAAKRLAFKTVPVVRFGHLTSDQVRAYRLADNRLAELSGWDAELLTIEFQHLSALELEFDIGVIGWDDAEIDLMIDPVAEDEIEKGDPADANVPGPEANPISCRGDIWLLGSHRLMCGSALDTEDLATLMAGAKARMVFADAPYNCPVGGHVTGLGKNKHREFAMASGEMSNDEFTEFLTSAVQRLTDHCVDGAVLQLCMDWRQLLPLQVAIGRAGLDLINLAVWVKSNGGMGSLYRSQHELVLIAKKGRAPHVNNVQLGRFGRYRTNVWRYAGINSFGKGRAEQLAVHPTCKPIALVADAIRDVSNAGDIVLDTFMGSGTTLLAAERRKRIAYGMDIDPLYVDVAIRRWEAMTGCAATLAGFGKTFAMVTKQKTAERAIDGSTVVDNEGSTQ